MPKMMSRQQYERKVAKIRNNSNLTLTERRHKIGMLDRQWQREMRQVQEANGRRIQILCNQGRKFID